MSNRTHRGNPGINPAMMHAPIIDQRERMVEIPRLPVMKECPFIPIGSMVAMAVDPLPKEAPGGIIIPPEVSGQFWNPMATVLEVGPECKQVKKGDRVLGFARAPGGMARYLPTGEECFLIEESELAGVIKSVSTGETPSATKRPSFFDRR